MKTKVSTLLENKDEWILTIDGSRTAFDAVQKMFDHEVGSIIVLENGQPEGIFTERDYIRRVVLDDQVDKNDPVSKVMTSSMICVDPDYTVEQCMAIMTHQRCRHLPVMRNGSIEAMISIGDCTKQLSKRADLKIQHLEDYITRKYPR